MGKKCIPGVICIENMTLFILIVLTIMIGYFYYNTFVKPNHPSVVILQQSPHSILSPALATAPNMPMNPTILPLATSVKRDTLNDPYAPPLKVPGVTAVYHPRDSSDVRGIPVNIRTQPRELNYQQLGILTRPNSRNKEDLILPLMGRKHVANRDKWQYYTISNTGNLNTKLPVSKSGRSCTSEYGCDELMNGDTIFVEGYNEAFKTTIYENSMFNYIPYL